MFKKTSKVFVAVRDRLRKYRKKTLRFVDKHPLRSFFILLAVTVVLIVVSNFLGNPANKITQNPAIVKNVDVYTIGSAPKITVQAKVIKSGVIQINALSGGVIDNIYQEEGATVSKGTLLIGMSSNYQGGNAPFIQTQISQAQYDNAKDTYNEQKELIQKQKDLANKTDENSDQLRDITSKSIDETNNLISLNEDILNTLDENINTLTEENADPALILSTKQLKSQFLASTNAAKSSLRNAQQNSADDKAPAQLSDLQREVAIKQLDIQEKQLDLNKEMARLQLAIAQVNQGAMFPVAPFSGTVQRVLVKENESVTPGTPLMIFSQNTGDKITAVAFVSHDIAKRISEVEESVLHLGGTEYSVTPSFISTEAVSGTLYAVYFPIPDSYTNDTVSEGYISVDIPIGYADTTMAATYIPLDSVYQTRDKSYIFVDENGKAKSKDIQLGSVFGRFAEVVSGVTNGDQIILDRNVIDGDLVKAN